MKIGDAGSIAIGNALKKNTSLSELNLSKKYYKYYR
jgi:hypothetical protein